MAEPQIRHAETELDAPDTEAVAEDGERLKSRWRGRCLLQQAPPPGIPALAQAKASQEFRLDSRPGLQGGGQYLPDTSGRAKRAAHGQPGRVRTGSGFPSPAGNAIIDQ
ncbi:hypothetical protein GCM10010470_54840 [Saccharopolyspora taberi]|uniref:Uncharacterized protein n=1 Tax=Saccharopolyspora taberi TaxID=60895 RepID=A0ABN3VJW8_9PSEU